MDYDNPQFVAAVKKVLGDAIAQLTDSFKELKDSVSAHWEADEKRYQAKPVTITDLRTDVPIRVQTESKHSKPATVWGYIIGALEACAFLAVIFYTYFAYHQWQEMITANNVSMSNFRRARIDANGQLKEAMQQTRDVEKQFQLDQRPYIAIACCKTADITANQLMPPTIGKPLAADIGITNTGKSPAFGIVSHFHLLFGDDVMNIHADPPDSVRSEQIEPQGGPGTFVTAVSVKNTYTANVLKLDRSEIVDWDGKNPIVVFGRITYDDTFGNHYCTPFVYHWLHDTTWMDAAGLLLSDRKTKRKRNIPNMCPSNTSF